MKNTRLFSAIVASVCFILASLCAVFVGIEAGNTNAATIWSGDIAERFANETADPELMPTDIGTESNPYRISNGAELAFLQWASKQYGDIEKKYTKRDSSIHYILTNDIYLNDISDYDMWGTEGFDDSHLNKWAEIGPNSFCGNFDGNGHTIYGMYGDGLFGVVQGCGLSVKNLNLKNVYITKANAGALLRTAYGSSYWDPDTGSQTSPRGLYVENVHVDGTSLGGAGIAFDAGSSTPSVTLKDCTFRGRIIAKSGTNVSYLAGIISYISSGILTKISNCINYGDITRENTNNGYSGGIIGYWGNGLPGSVIENCHNYGTLTLGASMYAGGICGGGFAGIIRNCSNEAPVSNDKGYVGGIVGMANNGINIENCFNVGDISAPNSEYNGVGGIAGWVYGDVANCWNSGDVSGKNKVGGIAGAYYSSTGGCVNCVNSGDVTGTGNQIGGIVGDANVHITNSQNTGDVTGADFVGGVVGQAGLGATVVTNVLNDGQVIGEGDNVHSVCGSVTTMEAKLTFFLNNQDNLYYTFDMTNVINKAYREELIASFKEQFIASNYVMSTAIFSTLGNNYYYQKTYLEQFYEREYYGVNSVPNTPVWVTEELYKILKTSAFPTTTATNWAGVNAAQHMQQLSALYAVEGYFDQPVDWVPFYQRPMNAEQFDRLPINDVKKVFKEVYPDDSALIDAQGNVPNLLFALAEKYWEPVNTPEKLQTFKDNYATNYIANFVQNYLNTVAEYNETLEPEDQITPVEIALVEACLNKAIGNGVAIQGLTEEETVTVLNIWALSNSPLHNPSHGSNTDGDIPYLIWNDGTTIKLLGLTGPETEDPDEPITEPEPDDGDEGDTIDRDNIWKGVEEVPTGGKDIKKIIIWSVLLGVFVIATLGSGLAYALSGDGKKK
ncbi:MAG: hypothetical protein LBG88_00850 [Christensenellaceae bacterium]|jgi:hypothetical protein|nr:hypothetical protein [Christensenellaceae bacterium]